MTRSSVTFKVHVRTFTCVNSIYMCYLGLSRPMLRDSWKLWCTRTVWGDHAYYYYRWTHVQNVHVLVHVHVAHLCHNEVGLGRCLSHVTGRVREGGRCEVWGIFTGPVVTRKQRKRRRRGWRRWVRRKIVTQSMYMYMYICANNNFECTCMQCWEQ